MYIKNFAILAISFLGTQVIAPDQVTNVGKTTMEDDIIEVKLIQNGSDSSSGTVSSTGGKNPKAHETAKTSRVTWALIICSMIVVLAGVASVASWYHGTLTPTLVSIILVIAVLLMGVTVLFCAKDKKLSNLPESPEEVRSEWPAIVQAAVATGKGQSDNMIVENKPNTDAAAEQAVTESATNAAVGQADYEVVAEGDAATPPTVVAANETVTDAAAVAQTATNGTDEADKDDEADAAQSAAEAQAAAHDVSRAYFKAVAEAAAAAARARADGSADSGAAAPTAVAQTTTSETDEADEVDEADQADEDDQADPVILSG